MRVFTTWMLTTLALLTLQTPLRSAELGPEIPAARQGEVCVEPLEVIRREHMNLLRHQRDDTVHQGIRTRQHSLKRCVDCHARKDSDNRFLRIDGDGQFCASCHRYTAVRIDCFECHAAKPETGSAAAASGGGLATLAGGPADAR